MSVREINQRWLATMGLSDEQVSLRAELVRRADTLRAAYGARPPWWRLLARRRWDRWMAGVEERAIESMRAELVGTDGDMLPCPFCRTTEVDRRDLPAGRVRGLRRARTSGPIGCEPRGDRELEPEARAAMTAIPGSDRTPRA